MDIKGKSAIVTGSAGGIGRATAVMLAERGAAEIGLVDVKEDALAETARQLNEVNRRVRNLLAANVAARIEALGGGRATYAASSLAIA